MGEGMRERTDIGYWRGGTVEACIIMQASSKWTGHLVAPRLSVYDVLPGGVAEQARGATRQMQVVPSRQGISDKARQDLSLHPSATATH